MRATSIGHAGILIETEFGSITCDPWFDPAFFGSWFVFPRNDQLDPDLQHRIEHPDYLYISHIHGDHLDETWLPHHVSRDATVLLPGYPTRELERRLRDMGFTKFIRTSDGEEVRLNGELRIAIHVEVSITDGPGGDSALVVSDGRSRLVNQNDCRTSDLVALRAHGPVDLHWIQYSGAIWYPMVYEETPETMRELVDLKVESQLTRAMRYVEAVGARATVPSAGPPAFLDPELFGLNRIDGDELNIFPDQRVFMDRLARGGHEGILAIPGTTIEIRPDGFEVTHPMSETDVAAIFEHKREYLEKYQADYLPWLDAMKAGWTAHSDDLLGTVQAWWEPLLAMAPTLRAGVGANVLLRAGDVDILIDFPNGQVRAWHDEPYDFRFVIQRELVETVVAQKAVDWSNSLFLSARFRAWRRGNYNEYVYNFFKSLSVERMRRTEAEALRKADPERNGMAGEEIRIGDHVCERLCPHRQADLAVFGEIEGDHLVCTLHGWKFDLATGECLNATNRKLKIRPA
ncbi:MAG: Rieske 2Fe-2S domain-containing protein [Acidimicrobiales bacterium]|nr:Rieske 2Fe-2S domain-containing protein [Acidimicrobiales bacterium]MCB9392870.1 Rieske 2Fe-2S domain-containing protein [Acidimicrobiaceae bacterium]